jgi:hypothetical protein
MTRKDYELIAKVFAKAQTSINTGKLQYTADTLIQVLVLTMGEALAKDNPRFDYARFFTACEAN